MAMTLSSFHFSVLSNSSQFKKLHSSLTKLDSSLTIPRHALPGNFMCLNAKSEGDWGISSSHWIGNVQKHNFSGKCEATMAGQSITTAKEMERIAAKEALLFAISDAGGFQAIASGNATGVRKADVSERILALERLNSIPRPTTSPLLEGLWEFQWAASPTPGFVVSNSFLRSFPPSLASIEGLDLLITDGRAISTARLKFLATIDMKLSLSTRLTVEGPSRLREEYEEALVTAPSVPEGTVPSQLQGLYDQLVATSQRLPDAIKETLSAGFKFPLSGAFERHLIISYLDEEILVARDISGSPEVLVKVAKVEPIMADMYES